MRTNSTGRRAGPRARAPSRAGRSRRAGRATFTIAVAKGMAPSIATDSIAGRRTAGGRSSRRSFRCRGRRGRAAEVLEEPGAEVEDQLLADPGLARARTPGPGAGRARRAPRRRGRTPPRAGCRPRSRLRDDGCQPAPGRGWSPSTWSTTTLTGTGRGAQGGREQAQQEEAQDVPAVRARLAARGGGRDPSPRSCGRPASPARWYLAGPEGMLPRPWRRTASR